LIRLRKGESVSFTASLEWKDTDIIKANQHVLLNPKIRHNFEERKFDMLMESRGFWTCRQILQQTYALIVQKLQHFRAILECKYEDEINNAIYEKDHQFKIIMASTNQPGAYLVCSLDVDIPDQVDFDLAIKNILHHIINNEEGCVFIFDYFSSVVSFSIASKDKFETILNNIKKREQFWKKMLD